VPVSSTSHGLGKPDGSGREMLGTGFHAVIIP
jgi:hypothetical protein